MMRRFLLTASALVLAACSANPITDVSTRADPLPDLLPPMKNFVQEQPATVDRKSNHDIARDFLELSFQLESGKTIEKLTRFSGPVTVSLAQQSAPRFEADLGDLLARIRNEAGIDIQQIATGTPANIVIQTLPRRKMQALVPQAACFVVPRVVSWDEFRKNRNSGVLDWSTLETRDRATVFIPDDVAPQEARDCLHEEIAQALGPLNDIYRLADSVYNDDNMNTALTGFDMLILRTYYSPQLKNGMTKQQVAAALPTVLKQLNPKGESLANDATSTTPREWIDTIEGALGARSPRGRRIQNARKAVQMATAEGWQDNRLGFSLFALGRLSLGQEPTTAIESFLQAYLLYSKIYGTDDIHTAHVALQLAAFSLSGGHSNEALDYVNQSLPSVARSQNAALLAAFLMIKAEALDFQGRHTEAMTVRLDSLGWARYGFASDDEIRARLRETAALRPGVK